MIQNFNEILRKAHLGQYAVGAFSARYTRLIKPIVSAGIATKSPIIVQLSQTEIYRHMTKISDFTDKFREVLDQLQPQIPIVLHLDHTKDLDIIKEAIKCGFNSIMIDASHEDFDTNVQITKKVVELAHKKNVSVEAELGKIGTTDFVETDTDSEVFTVPNEAAEFIKLTNIDALAVSVGTAHGLYTTKKPHIEYSIIKNINALTDLPLVLHGGSGVPDDMLRAAVKMKSGGVSKVNIATEIEKKMLESINETTHMLNHQINSIEDHIFKKAQKNVENLVINKIKNYLFSDGKAGS